MCLGGHSPALVGLYSAERKIYIAGDQILPKITPNISVVHWEPLADPLSVYLKSLDLLKAEIADDVMVLPSHQLPFHGLHRRIDELRAHHHQRLDHLRALLRDKNQLNAAEAMLSLFGQNLDGQQIFFAMGEALAHLNYLYARGEISCVRGHEGAYLYQIGH
jgi:glyoxylase-like metal-dependent hydrolase (beta-lactamase superfamily II)